MKVFERPLRVVGIKAAEIRLRMVGPHASAMAKLAYMTEDGASAGQFILHSFSERTQRIIQALERSIEEDAASLLCTEAEEVDEDEDPGEGPSYGS